jgi:hypothetical protein
MDKGCRLNRSPYQASAVNGADGLIHCLERSPVNVQATHFQPIRGSLATTVTPNVSQQSGGTPAQIRALWLRDLYPQ